MVEVANFYLVNLTIIVLIREKLRERSAVRIQEVCLAMSNQLAPFASERGRARRSDHSLADNVGVVAGAAFQHVEARAALQGVVACSSGKAVVTGVPDECVIG